MSAAVAASGDGRLAAQADIVVEAVAVVIAFVRWISWLFSDAD